MGGRMVSSKCAIGSHVHEERLDILVEKALNFGVAEAGVDK
jgi:hypothetical protein